MAVDLELVCNVRSMAGIVSRSSYIPYKSSLISFISLKTLLSSRVLIYKPSWRYLRRKLIFWHVSYVGYPGPSYFPIFWFLSSEIVAYFIGAFWLSY